MVDPSPYGDVPTAVKLWLTGSSVAPMVTVAGRVDIYLAMPKAAPNPAIILTLVAGRPVFGKDVPEVSTRLSISCWGPSRYLSDQIARQIVGELEGLARSSEPVLSGGVYLLAADVLNIRWLPDPDSDTPRTIVDALITTVTA